MNKKEEHIRKLLEMADVNEGGSTGVSSCRWSRHYLAYFALFNQQKFYEAHDVLEDLWLRERNGPNNNFYKALIQLAGAFLHLQKSRIKPAVALFRLSRSYLEVYPAQHEGLDVRQVMELIDSWTDRAQQTDVNPGSLLTPDAVPRLIIPTD